MVINSFTVIDAFNQFWEVWEVADRRSLTYVGLYFYIVKKWNVCGRPNVIRLQNNLICAELEISKPTLDRARNWLKQNGLVDFFSKGKGDSNISYQVMEVKVMTVKEVKKEKNFTSNVTSPVTSGDSLNKEKELFVVVNGEVKNFYYLKNLFGSDAGLKLAWEQKFFPPEKFADGLELWMIQNHGKPYQALTEARKHFLFWIPNFSIDQQKQQKNGFKKQSPGNNSGTARTVESLLSGLDG